MHISYVHPPPVSFVSLSETTTRVDGRLPFNRDPRPLLSSPPPLLFFLRLAALFLALGAS